MDVPKADLTQSGRLGWQRVGNQILMRCPYGHIGDLTGHTIYSHGTVDPSVKCTRCDFHEHLKLLDWTP